MPSANEVPDFFDDEDTEFPFAPSAPAPAPATNKKGKKKSKKNAAKGKGGGAEGRGAVMEGMGSPPKEVGARAQEEEEAAENGGFGGEIADEQTSEPEPAAPLSPARAPSPAPLVDITPARSPRPAHAQPIPSVARTPPSRPSSLNSPPRHYSSLGGYQPNSSIARPPAQPVPPTKVPATQPAPSNKPPANPIPPTHPVAPTLTRRESATAHTSPRPRFVEPVAPPHKAQPHFYGIPDFGLNLGQQKMTDLAVGEKPAGSDGYCCCLDSFADGGDAVSGKKVKDALLVGSEGALDVYRVLPKPYKVESVGRLEGLRGSVIGAKVLPQVMLEDSMQKLRPLVAVVVHGAMAEEKGKDGDAEDEAPGYYQTSVEVYSFQDQSHVATLYRSTPVAVEKPTLGHLASVPGPVGDLTVTAEGRFVVVASGKSGEVFVFSHAATAESLDEDFRCLGKFWTSLQTSPTPASSRPQSSSEGGATSDEKKDDRVGVPIFSLSQRWLAVMAPSTSAHVSIGGSPLLLDSNPTPPGAATHVAPPQPPISCDIAGVDSEGTWSRLTRQAAQGLVKYSAIGFEMGRQGWRELTNPAPQSTGQHSRGLSREHDAFPPTMAPADDPNKVVKEPAIVSIIDLDSLLEAEELKPKYVAMPLSTFALQEGCNYLALSSNGLRLLSVSRSGKVSTIWDLAQSCHGTARLGLSPTEDEETAQGPCVKQVHRFERNSESVVVDAVWSRDDDMLAVLTSPGTVHLHEIRTRPSRKRKRRSTSTVVPSPAQSEKAQPTVSVQQGMSPPSSNGWMGSLKSGLAQVSTQVSTVRTQSSMPSFRPTFAGFRDFTATAGQVGGRAIARGLNQGFTAARGGVGDLWHAEENKIRHAGLKEKKTDLRGVLRWVRRREGSSLAVVSEGRVHMHSVSFYERRRGDEVVTGLKHDRGADKYSLPGIRTAASAGDKKRDDPCDKAGAHGFWSLRPTSLPGINGRVDGRREAQAHEVETNPPYCPFHVDPRVGIYAFQDEDALSASQAEFGLQGHGIEDEDPWLFGAPLPESVKLNGNSHDEGALGFAGSGGRGEIDSEDELAGQVESRLTVFGDEGEVRVHTRPRAGGGGDGKGERDLMGDVDAFDEEGI